MPVLLLKMGILSGGGKRLAGAPSAGTGVRAKALVLYASINITGE